MILFINLQMNQLYFYWSWAVIKLLIDLMAKNRLDFQLQIILKFISFTVK